jgi:hypothetical protein
VERLGGLFPRLDAEGRVAGGQASRS